MLLPQGWSLSLELMFYAIAPFLVRRSLTTVTALIATGLALRAWIYVGLGYNLDPWAYRFFPIELSLFLGGTLSYHFYEWLKRRHLDRRLLIAIGIAFGLITILYNRITGAVPHGYTQVVLRSYFSLTVAVISILFLWTKDSGGIVEFRG